MRLTGAADVLEPISETLPWEITSKNHSKVRQMVILLNGNEIGLATTHVSEIYDEGYKAKTNGSWFCSRGSSGKDWVRREKPVIGDVVIVLGGATGRDGVGGATGSSKEQDETSMSYHEF